MTQDPNRQSTGYGGADMPSGEEAMRRAEERYQRSLRFQKERRKHEEVDTQQERQYRPMVRAQQNQAALHRRILLFSLFVAVLSIAGFVNVPSTSGQQVSYEVGEEAWVNRSSARLLPGDTYTREAVLDAQDMAISHRFSEEETELKLWALKANRIYYVEVLVNDRPLTPPFALTNNPTTITVPSIGKVEVRGVREDEGPVQYGLMCACNDMSYLNGVERGQGNVYRLQKEQEQKGEG